MAPRALSQHPGLAGGVNYYGGDHGMPVGDARRSAEFFNTHLYNNLGAYAESVSEDRLCNLFGEDHPASGMARAGASRAITVTNREGR